MSSSVRSLIRGRVEELPAGVRSEPRGRGARGARAREQRARRTAGWGRGLAKSRASRCRPSVGRAIAGTQRDRRRAAGARRTGVGEEVGALTYSPAPARGAAAVIGRRRPHDDGPVAELAEQGPIPADNRAGRAGQVARHGRRFAAATRDNSSRGGGTGTTPARRARGLDESSRSGGKRPSARRGSRSPGRGRRQRFAGGSAAQSSAREDVLPRRRRRRSAPGRGEGWSGEGPPPGLRPGHGVPVARVRRAGDALAEALPQRRGAGLAQPPVLCSRTGPAPPRPASTATRSPLRVRQPEEQARGTQALQPDRRLGPRAGVRTPMSASSTPRGRRRAPWPPRPGGPRRGARTRRSGAPSVIRKIHGR